MPTRNAIRNSSGKDQEKVDNLFVPADFTFAENLSFCICPAGKRLYRSGNNVKVKNCQAVKFKGPKSACVPCTLRAQCLRTPEKKEIRQVAYLTGRSASGKPRFTEQMKQKIDSTVGRMIYSCRLAVGEPSFAHIRSVIGLDRFTLRGNNTVNAQWDLFCIINSSLSVL